MAVQPQSLPKNLPPRSHLHLCNFVIPDDRQQNIITVRRLVTDITGLEEFSIFEEYGQRFQYRKFYTVRNELNSVLLTVYTDGTGRFRDTVSISICGLAFETWNSNNPLNLDPAALANYVFARKGHFTRLDVARNDYRRQINWAEMLYCSEKSRYRDRIITRLSRTKPPYYCRQDAESLYFGSNKSRTQVLAYVKHDQQATKFPWIRVETKIRGRQQCDTVARMIAAGTDIDEISGGILAYLLDFKTESINSKQRRESCQWWTRFVGTTKIKLSDDQQEKTQTTDDTEKDDFDSVDFDSINF